MKTYSNFYIFIYASMLVIIVAILLSFTAYKLKPAQERNIQIKKEQDILASFGIISTAETAEELFIKHVVRSYLINAEGEEMDGDAFNINLKEQLAKPAESRQLPMFECDLDGNTIFIIPVWGVGMWGPIWGYIALESDFNTVFGATFAHDAETPGLGAEIDTRNFQEQFKGKKIFDDSGKFISVAIVKGGAPDSDRHGVDAISGGTITSIALQNTISECLENYVTYFKNNKN